MCPKLLHQPAGAILAAALALGLVGTAGATEVVTLVDNTQVAGKLVHFFDGVLVLETATGQKLELPRDKVKQIVFKLPPARAEFSTPEKTFERWRKALTEGAVEKIVDCYALMYQGMLATQMGLGDAQGGLKKMQKEIEGTKFQIKGSSIKGDTATLKVLRQKGDESDTGDIAFVRENGEWKMLPPQ